MAVPVFLPQDWTKLEIDDEHQGLVEITYRSSSNTLEPPPDLQAIQKQMAIVAWQPGPNRVLQVPSEVRNPWLIGAPSTFSDRPLEVLGDNYDLAYVRHTVACLGV